MFKLYLGETMKILIYISIFTCKIIEDALSTLRIIVVSNGKKKFGAILQFIIALIWVFVTGTVIVNVNKDPLKILFFALGSLVGSYLGSILEEKIALGNNTIIASINPKYIKKIKKEITNNIETIKEENNKLLLMITCQRKETKKIIKKIKKIDSNASIFFEKVKIISSHT